MEIHLAMLKQNNKKPELLKLPRGLLEEVKKMQLLDEVNKNWNICFKVQTFSRKVKGIFL